MINCNPLKPIPFKGCLNHVKWQEASRVRPGKVHWHNLGRDNSSPAVIDGSIVMSGFRSQSLVIPHIIFLQIVCVACKNFTLCQVQTHQGGPTMFTLGQR